MAFHKRHLSLFFKNVFDYQKSNKAKNHHRQQIRSLFEDGSFFRCRVVKSREITHGAKPNLTPNLTKAGILINFHKF